MFDNHQRFLLPSSSTPIVAMASSSLWHFRMTLNSVMMSSSEIQRKFQEALLWRKCFQRQQCNILPKTANNTTRSLKMGRASSGVELLYHHRQNAASARRKHGGGTKTTILQPCLFFFCNYKGYFSPRTADKENEEAMICRRTVYDHDDWMRHRSSTRHAKHLLSVASSRVILALGPPVMTLTAIAAAITGYNEAVLTHALSGCLSCKSRLFLSRSPHQRLHCCLSFVRMLRMGGLMRAGRPGDRSSTEQEISLGKH